MSRRLSGILALLTGAVLFTGMFVAGTGASAKRVQAAEDSSLTTALKGAFDPTFYSSKYDDVKKLYGNDPEALFDHFIKSGIKEGRMINADFDPKAYMQAYVDVKAYCNGDYVKAYEHYFNHGRSEGRKLTTFAAIYSQGAKVESGAVSTTSGTGGATGTTQKVDIGYGLTAVLTADQLSNAEIRVYQSDYGYGAYLVDANGNESLVASTQYYFPWEDSKYVSTVEVNVVNNSETTVAPTSGTDIVTYHNIGVDELTNAYNHYANDQNLNLVPGSTSESVDWDGNGNTPYILQFGFGEYNSNYVETGVATYSPQTGHIDVTETGVLTNVPWADNN